MAACTGGAASDKHSPHGGLPDFATARAYYAAFYAASALLLAEGKTFRSHRGVVALIHRDYVKPGRLPVDIGSFNGFKEHFAVDLDSKVTREVVVRPANEPEHEAVVLLADTVSTFVQYPG